MIHDAISEWITANAGSGKTTALTQRVVRLLLAGVAPENIVCITYTRAAANEMRGRVLDMLRALLLAGDADCALLVGRLLGTKPADAQTAYARSLFGRVIDSAAGGLQLMTIHGFCKNMLRCFPMEAGVAPHFTVMDEAASDEALRTAKHALICGLHSADKWLGDAVALIGVRGGETRFESLASSIISHRRFWDALWRVQSPDSLRAHIYALNGVDIGMTQVALDAGIISCISAGEVAIICEYLPSLLSHPTKTYRQFGDGLATWLATGDADRAAASGAFILLFVTKSDLQRRKTILNDKEYPPHHPLRDVVEAVAERVLRYVAQSQSLACAEESFAVAVLARSLLDVYRQIKQSVHALDYDDLIAYSLALCSQPETLGWVMSRLDHRIDHLLIDEAQDNSVAQWDLARVLVEELIAGHEAARSVLVVGDEKQSIYSFQGAAPEEFQRYRGIFRRMLEGSISPLVESTLDYSYRSSPAVLALVNHLCAHPLVAAAIMASGDCPVHRLTRKDASGRVLVYPPLIVTAEESGPPLAMPMRYPAQAGAPQQLAEQVATMVHRWLMVEKRTLESEGRALKAGDIIILVKNRNPLVQPMIRALQRRGVAVAGLDRLLLADHLAVRDLLALMRWCLNIGDDLALAQVLRSPLVGWTDENLRTHAYGRPATLWQQVDEPWLLQVLGWKESSPYDFLTQVLEVSGRRRDFARRFGEEVHEVLDELKAQAAAIPANMQPGLAQFEDWISAATRLIKREQESGEADLVRIMTIHGAKGLEAPVVILADTVNMPTTQREVLFTEKNAHGQHLPVVSMSELAKKSPGMVAARSKKLKQLLDEHYRLLYVAVTRARDELHVLGMANAKGVVKEGSWYQLIDACVRALGAAEEGGIVALRDELPSCTKQSVAVPELLFFPPLPLWASTALRLENHTPLSFSPSGFAAVQPSRYVGRGGDNTRERGIRIHRVLELLRVDTTSEGIKKLVSYVAPDWSAAQQKEAATQISTLHNKERWLWQYNHQAEVSIVGTITYQGRRIAVNGQIDALIQTPDAMIILDYKTGKNIPESADNVPENYLLQLKIYRELLHIIHPQMRLRCVILWTDVPCLMWLDEQVENARFSIDDGVLAAS